MSIFEWLCSVTSAPTNCLSHNPQSCLVSDAAPWLYSQQWLPLLQCTFLIPITLLPHKLIQLSESHILFPTALQTLWALNCKTWSASVFPIDTGGQSNHAHACQLCLGLGPRVCLYVNSFIQHLY